MDPLASLDKTAVADNEDLLATLLRGYGSDADPAIGTAVRELAVNPAALYHTYTANVIDTAMNNLSLTTGTDEATAEAMLANFGVIRRQGTVAAGSIALITNVSSVVVPQRITFAAGADMLVLAKTYIGVTDFAALNIVDDGSYRELRPYGDGRWYMIIPATTAAAPSGIISAGLALTASETIPGVDSISVAGTFSGGSTTETLEQMKARVPEAIAAKVPSGREHIVAMLENTTPPALDVSVIGMGDVEMTRWKSSFGVNAGGRVDVYAKAAQYPGESIATLSATFNSRWRMIIPKTAAPGWYVVTKIEHSSGSVVTPYDLAFTFSADISGETYPPLFTAAYQARFSKYQVAVMDFDFAPIATPTTGQTETFTVTFSAMPSIDVYQDMLASQDTSNPNGDYLVRAPIPVFVGVELIVRYNDVAEAPDATQIKNSVAAAVNSTPMRRGYVSGAEIASAVKALYPTIVVVAPVVITGVVIQPDGETIVVRSADTLKLPEKPEISMTRKTMAFMCAPTLVSVAMTGSDKYLA